MRLHLHLERSKLEIRPSLINGGTEPHLSGRIACASPRNRADLSAGAGTRKTRHETLTLCEVHTAYAREQWRSDDSPDLTNPIDSRHVLAAFVAELRRRRCQRGFKKKKNPVSSESSHRQSRLRFGHTPVSARYIKQKDARQRRPVNQHSVSEAFGSTTMDEVLPLMHSALL